jgi:hypothetical protein
MSSPASLIPANSAILVLGSLNAKAEDRYMKRSAIRPVQVIIENKIYPVAFFDSWGEFGVSSMAWRKQPPWTLFVSTGSDLIKLDTQTGQSHKFDIPMLKDIHEITIINNTLWLANTGLDEVIAFDIPNEQVIERRSLDKYRTMIESDIHKNGMANSDNGKLEIVDKFHCNQIFEGFDKNLYCLVHHVSGIQKIRRFTSKVVRTIKSQGDGGVINLSADKSKLLNLMAPHHVRKVQGFYWLFDSGNNSLNIYDRDWKIMKKIPTQGFGRGADISQHMDMFYAGISETRKRYLRVIPGAKQIPNMIQVFSIKKQRPIGEILLSDIEQVNNTYLISQEIANVLIKL